jgi:hypothetical protein
MPPSMSMRWSPRVAPVSKDSRYSISRLALVTGEVVAEVAGGTLAMDAVLDYARRVGGPALRRLTFHPPWT